MAEDVATRHPDYADRADEWAVMRDCARGETAVKDGAERHLPMPSGFRVQKDGGTLMYGAYRTRAQFPDILAPTLRGMVGVIHRTEAQIDGLDDASPLAYLWERATPDGLPLEALHRRITGEILLMGRYGLLTDVASDGNGRPFLAGYATEAVVNWSDDRTLFVLDESGRERSGFTWTEARRYRVLRLDGGRYTQRLYRGAALTGTSRIEPKAVRGKALSEIPFVVFGPRDLAVTPEEAPLIGVARASLALYRLDADYRHQLYMSGQETLVIVNGKAPSAVGAGVVIELTGDGNGTPDAKYVGPKGTGIEAHERAIAAEQQKAVASGARIFDSAKQAESGEALRLRYAAQTATLTSVSMASAQGLERALRHAAVFVGMDPTRIVVKPNLRFVDAIMTAADAEALVRVWQGGAISKLTLYENLQRGELASAERSFENEEALIAAEAPDPERDAAIRPEPLSVAA